VGFDNFLRATELEQLNGLQVVRPVPDGPLLHCSSAASIRACDEVALATRGAFLELSRENFPDPQNVLIGCVKDMVYYGETLEYQVQVGTIVLNVSLTGRDAAQRNGAAPLVGDTVSVRIGQDTIVVLPK